MTPNDSWIYDEIEPEPEVNLADDPRTDNERILDEMWLDWYQTRESVRP